MKIIGTPNLPLQYLFGKEISIMPLIEIITIYIIHSLCVMCMYGTALHFGRFPINLKLKKNLKVYLNGRFLAKREKNYIHKFITKAFWAGLILMGKKD